MSMPSGMDASVTHVCWNGVSVIDGCLRVLCHVESRCVKRMTSHAEECGNASEVRIP